MILLSLVLTLIGMLLLYKCSAKQISKAKQQVFIRYKAQLRVLAYICFLIAGSLLCFTFGSSIGFISWWIFATPVTFVLVLSVNELKPTKK
ncbi:MULTISPECIES: hypothetical protein [Acinetobacter]|uniref:hypothetical protein n=1 Tax=Acinetobacter TaxID=469 RepID=UPI00051C3236|nr:MULTISPECIES: hypothetical protein [Acinetobacter]MCH7378663.1 DUF1634 domain-containing protein [Acinetobacter higginsii]MCJ0827007.1 DUF1634 domain-containing protein [Acinetobacter sp. NIPH1876]